jgi:multiubiquitin
MDAKHDSAGQGRPAPKHEPFPIFIDREQFKVDKAEMTGAELRGLPTPPLGADRDLYQVVPGGDDIPVADDKTVELKPGMRFVTAPHINPGANDGGD